VPEDLYAKISFLPLDVLYLGQGEDVYVQVPADLDQFGRKDSHGTVIGWKGLIQLGHDATNRGRFFDQVHKIPRICEIQGRLHPCNSTANHQD
jgi:hypothetical protein